MHRAGGSDFVRPRLLLYFLRILYAGLVTLSPLAIGQKNQVVDKATGNGRSAPVTIVCVLPCGTLWSAQPVPVHRHRRTPRFSAHLPCGSIRVTPGEFTFGGNLCFRQRRKTARVGQLSAREFHTRWVRNEGFREREGTPRGRSFVKFSRVALFFYRGQAEPTAEEPSCWARSRASFFINELVERTEG